MAKAYKCDRCGKTVEQPIPASVLVVYDPMYPYKDGKQIYLCGSCDVEFIEFLNKK